MNASVVRWHLESARISLECASRLGDRTANHALKVLKHPWPVGGRPPSNDAEALEAVLRINRRGAPGMVARTPAQKRRLQRKLKAITTEQ